MYEGHEMPWQNSSRSEMSLSAPLRPHLRPSCIPGDYQRPRSDLLLRLGTERLRSGYLSDDRVATAGCWICIVRLISITGGVEFGQQVLNPCSIRFLDYQHVVCDDVEEILDEICGLGPLAQIRDPLRKRVRRDQCLDQQNTESLASSP